MTMWRLMFSKISTVAAVTQPMLSDLWADAQSSTQQNRKLLSWQSVKEIYRLTFKPPDSVTDRPFPLPPFHPSPSTNSAVVPNDRIVFHVGGGQRQWQHHPTQPTPPCFKKSLWNCVIITFCLVWSQHGKLVLWLIRIVYVALHRPSVISQPVSPMRGCWYGVDQLSTTCFIGTISKK